MDGSQNKPNKIVILHETGAPRHFEGLLHYIKRDRGNEYAVSSTEFAVIKHLMKAVLARNIDKIKRWTWNIGRLIRLVFSHSQTVIVGMAPYDHAVLFMLLLRRRNRLIYYTSWPYWDKTKQPKRIITGVQLRLWKRFLSDIEAVAVTKKAQDGLLQYTSHVTVIPHCINTSVFKPPGQRRKVPFRILYVGRLVPEKGVDLILDIIEDVKAMGLEVEWWFVGDGPLKDKICSVASENESVEYKGFIKEQEDLAGVYSDCHVLLLPSHKESHWEELFGIVLIEAMACGVVPIATDCVGPNEIISHAEDGFIISVDDRQDLLQHITALISDETWWHQLSDNAVQKAKRNYDVNIVADLWASVIQGSTVKEL